MTQFSFFKTFPGLPNYNLFEEVPKLLYPENSPRFTLGHEPQNAYLEGCYIMKKNGLMVGRFALYVNPHLSYNNQTTTCIGSYECEDFYHSSTALINHAIKLSKALGVSYLIGPMEGSTWNTYRFSANNNTPNFFMEPYHHAYYVNQFRNANFKVISQYYSNLDTKLDTDPSTLNTLENEYKNLGGHIRHLNMKDFDNEMRKLAQCSIDWFQNNFLFTSISIDEFVAKYSAIKALFDPQLVWMILDKQHQIQAFIFGIKDYWDPKNESLIIKSVARNPNSQFKKAGTFLGGRINQMAKKKGFRKVIHAMMISDNASLAISKYRTGTEIKSYQLFGLKL